MSVLVDDRTIAFLLYDVFDAEGLTRLPHFSAHSREVFELTVSTAAKLSRETLHPLLRKMDAEPPRFEDGRIKTHPELGRVYAALRDAGYLSMSRPESVGGLQLPVLVGMAVQTYLDAANIAAVCYLGLTVGAARLIESFGPADLKQRLMQPMYEGRYTGTMALTEPQAGSSLADIRTRATPADGGHYLIEGEKVFISGGDNSFAENIVHLTLARIEGAAPGTKGVSLFAVPAKRIEGGALVDNDVRPSGLFHKMGWKALPSIALKFGDEGRCHGYLVGKAGEGLKCMFQMMNEARLDVGLAGIANASAAYQAALAYAKTRPQGRALTNRDARSPQVPIVEHADVRRMLLAQKAIVEGGLSLLFACGKYIDLAEAETDADKRQRAQKLLDLLTPLAKSYPAEKGFEANVLAVQVHGGYGYTSEYLPELLLREQKLNSLHEGTTGIQSLDLLGRKIFMDMGLSVGLLGDEMRETLVAAAKQPVLAAHARALEEAFSRWTALLAALGSKAQSGEMERAMATSVWHLELAWTVVVAWQWLRMAERALARPVQDAFSAGKLAACDYWFSIELTRVPELCARIEAEPAYLRLATDAL